MKLKKGYFIAIEGIEGAGKTTTVKFLAERLKQLGYEVVTSGESVGTPFAAECMNLLKSGVSACTSHLTRLFLINAARNDVYQKITAPALELKKIVIYDRFLLSTKAYQHNADEYIDALHEVNDAQHLPDLTIILDICPENAVVRMHDRGEVKDHFEMAPTAAIERRRDIMVKWHLANPTISELVPANASIGDVADRVLNCVERHLHPLLDYSKAV